MDCISFRGLSSFGLTLPKGLGLSSLIGGMSVFFCSISISIIIAIVYKQKLILYPVIILLVMTAVGRLAAWAIHDASFAIERIVAELIFATILALTAKNLETKA
ncbi:hypothetical protein [Glaciecola petra]|uniref:DUF4345 domain-containing protein n=1 Tax=Glaciecola petra TaxID=3075602 RepID=A0ABU2ZVZ5_9ALTE|nr:hypothetical protein [Aestuariibacter sp. P117]MDT0596469.1 hypothetical protein [Aestuariibacter sp. P117]